MFLRIVSSWPVFPVRIRKVSGAAKKAFDEETAEGVFGAAVGETGGVAHPPIVVPSAPVGLQGAEGGEAARAGEPRRRAKADPATIGPYRTTQAVTGERREGEGVGTRGTRVTESPWRIVGWGLRRGGQGSLSCGKNLGQGNRQPRQKGRLEPVPETEFQRLRIASSGQPEDLDSISLRIHDPVLGNANPFIEGMFHPAIDRGRRRGQDLDEQVRDTLEVLFRDEGHMLCEWNHKMALVPRYASVFRVPPYASFLRYLHNLVILFAVNLLPSFSIQKN